MSERHFPVNRELLMESVQKIIIEQGRSNPFTNNKPGKKWFQSFLKRHPDITEKTAQNLTKSRHDVSEEDIRKWFDEIGLYLEEKGLLDILQNPSRVFNTDESAFFLSPKAGRVLCKRGEKHLYNFCGDEKENLTVLITANAAGQLAPPMIVFKYERVPAHISASVPDHWGIGKSESGWMCGSTFYEFITNIFDPWLKQQNIQKPVLFFLDGHKSHLTLHLSNYCSENGIEIIALYPNSTHILQPMDVAVFRPLKVAWRKEVSKWQLDHLGQTLKKENFAPVLRNSLAAISQDCIQSGFRAGGLYPFGPDYIDMSKIKDNNLPQKEQDPRQTEFMKYLDSEIVLVFSPQKLELFNKMYYKNRHTLEQIIPPEDESLYVIWAKNKQLTQSANVLNLRNTFPSTSQTENITFASEVQESVISDALRVSDAVPSTSETFSQAYPESESSNVPDVSGTLPSTSKTDNNIASSQVQQESEASNILEIRDAAPTTSWTENIVTFSTVRPRFERPYIPNVSDAIPSTSAIDNFIVSSQVQPESKNTNVPDVSDAMPMTSETGNIITSSQMQQLECSNVPKLTVVEPSTSQCDFIAEELEASQAEKTYVFQEPQIDTQATFCETTSPKTTETHAKPSEICETRSMMTHETTTPRKHPLETVLGVVIPSPFKNNLFWPDEVKEKKKRKREKIPYAVTSKAWQAYHVKKSTEKQKQIEEKEKRAKDRLAKKILKERNLIDKKKTNRKKKPEEEDTTSEDTDLEVTYAESDNSYTEVHERQDNDTTEENAERVHTVKPL